MLLDVYGTNHDSRLWKCPGEFRPEHFGEWDGGAFNFIPHGGGDPAQGHRCPGEGITIALMATAVEMLTTAMDYDVPRRTSPCACPRFPPCPPAGSSSPTSGPGQRRRRTGNRSLGTTLQPRAEEAATEIGAYNARARQFRYNDRMTAVSYVMTVSQNGQVSIPADARSRWKARRAVVVDLGDRVVVRPLPDDGVEELEGKYRGRGPTTDAARRQARREETGRGGTDR